ncbi:MAG TPA: tetratricopeptide repeat protein [Thermoanaerobaculia bacterium]|jgi:Flp pilus assembly protein TadD|nr:tetratricopeptide repeat protein [Thermoanaerobaculia bacterium]
MAFDRLVITITAAAWLVGGASHAVGDAFQPQIPAPIVADVDAARAKLQQGTLDEAISILDKAVAAQPNFFRAHYNLGLAKLRKGDVDDGIRSLTQALQLREKEGLKDATIYNSLGYAYMVKRDWANGEKYLRAAAQHETENTQTSNQKVYNNLGLLYLYTGRFDDARKVFVVARDRFGSTQAAASLALVDQLEAGSRAQAAGEKKP